MQKGRLIKVLHNIRSTLGKYMWNLLKTKITPLSFSHQKLQLLWMEFVRGTKHIQSCGVTIPWWRTEPMRWSR